MTSRALRWPLSLALLLALSLLIIGLIGLISSDVHHMIGRIITAGDVYNLVHSLADIFVGGLLFCWCASQCRAPVSPTDYEDQK